MDFLRSTKDVEAELEPEPRRIFSPAGLRLSTIVETDKTSGTTKVGSIASKTTRRSSYSRGAFRLPEDDRSSQETWTNGYTYNIYSEKGMESPRLPPRDEAKGFFARRGGWRRLLLIALLFALVIVAIAIGLAVGLRKQGASSSSSSQSADSSSNTGSTGSSGPTGTTSGSGSTNSSGNATSNANFPIGSYSVEAFLDTIQSNCTSNAATWRCYPYTIYNDSPTKSLSVFNWIISADPKNSGSYVISSTNNPFAISFSGQPLTLEGKGTDQERYTFRTAMSKMVVPSTSITSDNSATTCFFNSTNFQGMLYTKMAKTYDPTSLGISRAQAGASYQDWPFAVRAEEVSSGGSGTPDCYKTVNGVIGDKVNVTTEDSGSLCSCLYRNWLTPSPY